MLRFISHLRKGRNTPNLLLKARCAPSKVLPGHISTIESRMYSSRRLQAQAQSARAARIQAIELAIPKEEATSNYTRNFAFAGLAAMMGIGFAAQTSSSSSTYAQCAPSHTEEDWNQELDQKSAVRELQEKLNPFREQAAKLGVSPPCIQIRYLPNEDTTLVQFGIPSEAARFGALSSFLHTLQPRGTYVGKHIAVHSVETESGSRSKNTVSLVFSDGSGSLSIRSSDCHPFSSWFSFYKDHKFTRGEIHAIAEAYMACYSSMMSSEPGNNGRSGAKSGQVSREDAIAGLQKLGLDVYHVTEDNPLTWDCLAGSEQVKQEVEDTIVLALQNPEVYEELAKKTRCRYETNRPKAVLFEGPPGCGKTLTARIIAQQTGIPMVHIPVESVVSKWYGDSEKKLAAIFEHCEELDGCIVFIDEVDALATSRGSGDMHEATRRMLSVLLQMLEGFDSPRKTSLVCATNRKEDLDPALLSRFDLSIQFDLPNENARKSIFQRYAKHLKEKELNELAILSESMSCRDIKEICEHTERKWISKELREQRKAQHELPNLEAYVIATKYRKHSMRGSLSNSTLFEA